MEESAPGADAHTCGIPSEAGAVGCFGEPEIAAVEQREQVGAVEDCGVFACVFAVVASASDIFITGHCSFEVVELLFEPFLSAENVEIVEEGELCDYRGALLPSVARAVVAVVELADIVCGHVKNGIFG